MKTDPVGWAKKMIEGMRLDKESGRIPASTIRAAENADPTLDISAFNFIKNSRGPGNVLLAIDASKISDALNSPNGSSILTFESNYEYQGKNYPSKMKIMLILKNGKWSRIRCLK